jgi:hypothetical protein
VAAVSGARGDIGVGGEAKGAPSSGIRDARLWVTHASASKERARGGRRGTGLGDAGVGWEHETHNGDCA